MRIGKASLNCSEIITSTQASGFLADFGPFTGSELPKGGVILPIPEPDPIRLADLIGYDDQKQLLLQNTTFFLSGYPANNVFIYGDRGTGKSSAIKALLHQFPDRPFRMLEISREDLFDLPDVMNTLRARPEYFVVFIDDLSFEEGETQYKTLKAVLEGESRSSPQKCCRLRHFKSAPSDQGKLLRPGTGKRWGNQSRKTHCRKRCLCRIVLGSNWSLSRQTRMSFCALFDQWPSAGSFRSPKMS